MAQKIKKGALKAPVEELVIKLCRGQVSDDEFKEGIKRLAASFFYLNNRYQSIGTILGHCVIKYGADEQRLSHLVIEVDTRIRRGWLDYKKRYPPG